MAAVLARGEGDRRRAERRRHRGLSPPLQLRYGSCAKPRQANAFAPNWGQTIFQSVSEMAQNEHIRERLSEILSTTQSEKEWWEKRKAEIQSDFLKELDEEKVKSPTESSISGSVKGGKAGSDDDAVMVESGGPAEKAGKGKKKKGKH